MDSVAGVATLLVNDKLFNQLHVHIWNSHAVQLSRAVRRDDKKIGFSCCMSLLPFSQF